MRIVSLYYTRTRTKPNRICRHETACCCELGSSWSDRQDEQMKFDDSLGSLTASFHTHSQNVLQASFNFEH